MKLGLTAATVLFLALGMISVRAAENTGSIAGLVTAPDGKPAAECQVQIFAANAQPQQRQRKPEPVATTKTDANGAFKLEKVPAGAYRLIAGQPFAEMGLANVTVKAGAASKINVTLKPRVGN